MATPTKSTVRKTHPEGHPDSPKLGTEELKQSAKFSVAPPPTTAEIDAQAALLRGQTEEITVLVDLDMGILTDLPRYLGWCELDAEQRPKLKVETYDEKARGPIEDFVLRETVQPQYLTASHRACMAALWIDKLIPEAKKRREANLKQNRSSKSGTSKAEAGRSSKTASVLLAVSTGSIGHARYVLDSKRKIWVTPTGEGKDGKAANVLRTGKEVFDLIWSRKLSMSISGAHTRLKSLEDQKKNAEDQPPVKLSSRKLTPTQRFNNTLNAIKTFLTDEEPPKPTDLKPAQVDAWNKAVDETIKRLKTLKLKAKKTIKEVA